MRIATLLFVLLSSINVLQAQVSANTSGPLNVSSCGGTNPPSWCAGTEIGAWINSAETYLSSLGIRAGELTIDAASSCYQFSTPIVITLPVTLRGAGPDATCLQYLGTGGIAVTYNTGDTPKKGYGLHDLQLAGPPGGGTALGLLINGPGIVLENVVIGGFVGRTPRGFRTGLVFGSNAYLSRITQSHFQYNDHNVYFPGSSTPANSGENTIFDHVTFANGNEFAGCVQIGDLGYDGPQVTFLSSSFDDCQLVNSNSSVTLLGGHFEVGLPQAGPYSITIDDSYLGFSGPHSTTLIGSQVFDNASMNTNGLFEVYRYGSLNMIGLSDRGTMLVPLVRLDAAIGGTPKFSIVANENQRTAAQLLSVAPGTVPRISILANGLIDTHSGYKLNGNLIIPDTAKGFHGGSGPMLQMSDGNGESGNLAAFGPDGTLVDGHYGISAFPLKTGTEVSGRVTCWKQTGLIGHCSSAIQADGSCTCN